MAFSKSLYSIAESASEACAALETALLDPNPQVLREFSRSGQLTAMIPEWQRIIGADNIQHNTHHYPLNEHTFKVVEGTKAASYYESLTDYQKLLATLSALLHDIDKNTGPARLRGEIPIDKLHPIKSAEMSREILTRLQYPPKTVQRIFTLIHHHQIFGRLFIIYNNGFAPLESLRKIAVKIRSTGVLDCLLALSEGDIRSVQREDAFFTPAVADRLAEYADTVRSTIQDMRQHCPIFPQSLVLNFEQGTIELQKSACFVVQGHDWTDLLEKVGQLHWGGGVMLPFYHSLAKLTEQKTPCAALIRFLPENIAYWGPPIKFLEPTRFTPVSMDLFYGILLGEAMHPENLSPHEQEALNQFLRSRNKMGDLLQSVSDYCGYENWLQSVIGFEEGWFEPSEFPLPMDPLLKQCSLEYREQFPDKPTVAVATRPILMGFYAASPSTVEFPPPWDQVPIFHPA